MVVQGNKTSMNGKSDNERARAYVRVVDIILCCMIYPTADEKRQGEWEDEEEE